MSDASKAARAAMKSKAERIAGGDPKRKVDASSWTPPEPLNTTAKTGLRPVSRRAYKKGGKVLGVPCVMRADRKPRKSGGATENVNAKINRNVKDANAEDFGKPHIGGLKTGGRAKRADGGQTAYSDALPRNTYRDKEVENTTAKSTPAVSKIAKAKGGEAKPPRYSRAAVDAAIASSNRSGRKIGGKEAAKIHALLKGPYETGDADTDGFRRAAALAGTESAIDTYRDITKKAKGGSVPMKDFLNGIKDKMKKRTTAPGLQKRGTFPTSMSKDDDKAFDANRADIMEASYNDYKAKKGKPSTPTVDLSEPDYKRTARKSGGRAKGKTNINIIISAGKGGAPAAPGDTGPVRPPMPAPMPAPMPSPAAPPPPMAGGAPPMPMPRPPGAPPGLVGRKQGGRVGHRSYKSYKDMDAGGLSGLGRLEKTAIAKSK